MPKPSKPEIALVRSATIAARRLKEAFEGQRIYVSSIPLSIIPYVFLRKAFHVQEAVITLCKKQMASEAYALSRVLVEMFITLRWITNDNKNARAKEYGFFGAKRKEYWAKILQKYQPNNPASADAVKYVVKLYGQYAAKYSSSVFWSREKLKAMAQEIEKLDPSPRVPKDVLWDYEVPYSMASDHVHSTVAALDPLVPIQGATYAVSRVSEPKLISHAAFTATVWLFKIARRVDISRKLGIEADIDKALRPFAKLANS